MPVWYASTGTVRALVSRGLMTYTNATTARLTPAGAREMEACQMQSRVLAGGDIRHESPEERESPKEKNT